MRWAVARLSAILLLLVLASPQGRADDLQTYAQQCDAATSSTVPDFDCDAGTEVPSQGPTFSADQPGVTCDEPNRLNQQCDPGSRFQVLQRSDDAYIVAHCRKEGGDPAMYGDIAVIQYGRKSGATCFYQALGIQTHGNLPGGHTAPGAPPKPVKAPSNGQAPNTFWLSPSGMVSVDHCGRCHDNGPFIRSPYINQVQGANELPGAHDTTFNSTQPFSLAGDVFAQWKSYKVEVAGNECNAWHRLAVSNATRNGSGTALDLGIRATAASEVAKNPPSAQSPIWMPPSPVQTVFSPAHADSAKAIHDCALRWQENPLPNSDQCRITRFAEAFTAPPVSKPPTIAGILRYLEQGECGVEAGCMPQIYTYVAQ